MKSIRPAFLQLVYGMLLARGMVGIKWSSDGRALVWPDPASQGYWHNIHLDRLGRATMNVMAVWYRGRLVWPSHPSRSDVTTVVPADEAGMTRVAEGLVAQAVSGKAPTHASWRVPSRLETRSAHCTASRSYRDRGPRDHYARGFLLAVDKVYRPVRGVLCLFYGVGDAFKEGKPELLTHGPQVSPIWELLNIVFIFTHGRIIPRRN